MNGTLRNIGCALLVGACATLVHAQGDPRRGEYLANAGGCLGCHTENKPGATPYSGGRPLKTQFGTFYGPNITPHPQSGIGRWSESDFFRAMRHGVRPDGANYFPAFPYTSFNGISDGDLRDLWAYLRTITPDSRPSRPHDLHFLYRWRFLITPWKWLYFSPTPTAVAPGPSDGIRRGAYLVRALSHCGECHTPRNALGGFKRERLLAGSRGMPNLTPARLKDWTDEDLRTLFRTGETPADGPVSDEMLEVVRNTTSRLTPEDLAAMIAYLRSLPPIPDEKR